MVTSSDYSYNLTRDGVIDAAARKINAISQGFTMSSGMRTDFANGLNALVTQWAARQLHVWTVSEAILFPQPNQVQYGAGVGATDHVTDAYYQTTLTNDAAIGQTVIPVAATTNMHDGDNIGFLLAGGSVQWTTVSSFTSSSVNIPNPGLVDVVAAGNYCWNYTNNIVRPLKVVAHRRLDIVSGIETPLMPPIARLDYMALPNKTQTGTINQVFYDPQLGIGRFYLWNPIAVVDTLLKFTYWRPIQDFTTGSNNPDMPAEWINPLVFNLALIMAPEYSVPEAKFNQIKALADQYLADAEGFDREAESIYMQYDTGP